MPRFHLHLIIPVLLAAGPLHAAAINPGAPGAVPPEDFRIMTPHEIAEHKATMASLSGTAREEYRNAQYRKLKERALAQGYLLPDTPPWGRTEVVPAVAAPQAAAGPTEDQRQAEDAAIMQQLIEEQKAVVQEALAGGQTQPAPAQPAATEAGPSATAKTAAQPAETPAASTESTAQAAQPAPRPAPPAMPPVPGPVTATPAETPAAATMAPDMAAQAKAPAVPPADRSDSAAPAPTLSGDSEPASPASQAVQKEYRDKMRQRFDSFMAQREARQQEREAERQRYAEELQRRREAYRQQQLQPQAQPYYQPAPAMPWPPYPPAGGYGRPPQPQPYAPPY